MNPVGAEPRMGVATAIKIVRGGAARRRSRGHGPYYFYCGREGAALSGCSKAGWGKFGNGDRASVRGFDQSSAANGGDRIGRDMTAQP